MCGCRVTAFGRARVGRHKLVGQGVLVDATAAVHSLAVVATLATWFGSPATKYLSLISIAVATIWTSPLG